SELIFTVKNPGEGIDYSWSFTEGILLSSTATGESVTGILQKSGTLDITLRAEYGNDFAESFQSEAVSVKTPEVTVEVSPTEAEAASGGFEELKITARVSGVNDSGTVRFSESSGLGTFVGDVTAVNLSDG